MISSDLEIPEAVKIAYLSAMTAHIKNTEAAMRRLDLFRQNKSIDLWTFWLCGQCYTIDKEGKIGTIDDD